MNKKELIVVQYLYDQYKISQSFIEKRFEKAKDDGDIESYNYFWGQYTAMDCVMMDLRSRGLVED